MGIIAKHMNERQDFSPRRFFSRNSSTSTEQISPALEEQMKADALSYLQAAKAGELEAFFATIKAKIRADLDAETAWRSRPEIKREMAKKDEAAFITDISFAYVFALGAQCTKFYGEKDGAFVAAGGAELSDLTFIMGDALQKANRFFAENSSEPTPFDKIQQGFQDTVIGLIRKGSTVGTEIRSVVSELKLLSGSARSIEEKSKQAIEIIGRACGNAKNKHFQSGFYQYLGEIAKQYPQHFEHARNIQHQVRSSVVSAAQEAYCPEALRAEMLNTIGAMRRQQKARSTPEEKPSVESYQSIEQSGKKLAELVDVVMAIREKYEAKKAGKHKDQYDARLGVMENIEKQAFQIIQDCQAEMVREEKPDKQKIVVAACEKVMKQLSLAKASTTFGSELRKQINSAEAAIKELMKEPAAVLQSSANTSQMSGLRRIFSR